MTVPYLACMAAVAMFYHLPPRVLPSIQAVEGGANGGVSRNANGTDDLGVMQINTIWLPQLARLSGLPTDAVRARLIDDACFNIAAAGAVMRTYLNDAGGDLMRAVGNYHSHTPGLHEAYRLKVQMAALRMFRGPTR